MRACSQVLKLTAVGPERVSLAIDMVDNGECRRIVRSDRDVSVHCKVSTVAGGQSTCDIEVLLPSLCGRVGITQCRSIFSLAARFSASAMAATPTSMGRNDRPTPESANDDARKIDLQFLEEIISGSGSDEFSQSEIDFRRLEHMLQEVLLCHSITPHAAHHV